MITRLTSLIRRWRGPYIWVVTILPADVQDHDPFEIAVWGVFTSGEKARQALKQWELNYEPHFNVRVLPLLANYRLLTAPPKYWSPDDRPAGKPNSTTGPETGTGV